MLRKCRKVPGHLLAFGEKAGMKGHAEQKLHRI